MSDTIHLSGLWPMSDTIHLSGLWPMSDTIHVSGLWPMSDTIHLSGLWPTDGHDLAGRQWRRGGRGGGVRMEQGGGGTVGSNRVSDQTSGACCVWLNTLTRRYDCLSKKMD